MVGAGKNGASRPALPKTGRCCGSKSASNGSEGKNKERPLDTIHVEPRLRGSSFLLEMRSPLPDPEQ